MGSCIICGASSDGPVCSTHEEDVAFEFEGNHPNQLTPGRYYRGTVDGFAEFGVFVDVGDTVTGLLHRSEIDQRLDSLDWDAGDKVFVQVTNVRDNGNVDLGWSIRQSTSEFRGALVDAPDGDREPEQQDNDSTRDSSEESAAVDDVDAEESGSADAGGAVVEGEQATAGTAAGSGGQTGELRRQETDRDATAGQVGAADETEDVALDRVAIESLQQRVGDKIRIEGEVVGIQQTSGPTVFELRDESGTIECAAFDGAGVRAFPEVELGDYVRLDGEVERRRNELQVETDTLLVLHGEEREAVVDRIEAAIEAEVRPDSVELLADHEAVRPLEDVIEAAATSIRRAVKEARPIVVRHAATADGYAAGAAIERAVLPLLRDEHGKSDAVYHYFDRRPTDELAYDMESATGDLTTMLENRDRHGEQFPLVVLAGIGATTDSYDAYELLDVYDVDALVVDDAAPDEDVGEYVDPLVAPETTAPDLSAAALGANVAAHVNEDVRDDLRHVPAVGCWEATPQVYADEASAAGFDDDDIAAIREALALEAHYQSYNDKRELVTDLLFERAEGLAAHISDQFREKLDTELETAAENAGKREAQGVVFQVLDTDAFTHRFDFPPTQLLVDALHRQYRDDEPFVTVAVGDDELHVRSTDPVDVRDIASAAAEHVDGIEAVGGPDGRIEFLAGDRDEALDAVVAAIATRIAA